jgi:1,4-alpha-glucan branching enzyme
MMKSKRSKKSAPASAPTVSSATHLQIHAPEAKAVFVAGTFNDWRTDATPLEPQGSGLWTVALELAPGMYEYLFVVDGCWCSDPCGSEVVPNPFGGQNAVLRVPRPNYSEVGK